MAAKQSQKRGQANTRARSSRRANTAESESGMSADPGAEMTNPPKKVAGRKSANDGRQKIQARHKAGVRKIENRLNEVSRSNKQAILEYRNAQLDQLQELVKRRLEVENEIAKRVLSLEEKYKEANRTVQATLQENIETLQE
ncbi:hypothetical protein H109_04523 [Trichophyton interdigitale MR816]|uniref:Uncharacterized protein n=1 Tax=Trichophyton interdigitale (strain MR816) TaxID=1215338 RepID=A0A059J7H3_TRIIM|nr:hypothetical protein H101_01347 [Trichophyton interdigitale H6]KDB23633.1 hypothetical protein H109_04523 [Trichophyton interdigitale MR816]